MVLHLTVYMSRYKLNKKGLSRLTNQPSEASAHFMFQLAKTVLMKAGGNSLTLLFVGQEPATSNTQTHRALHLCAFKIGLYALGLNNCVSPNWISRTNSFHVSWITGFCRLLHIPAECRVCFQDCTGDQASIQCDGCERWLHHECVGLTHTQSTTLAVLLVAMYRATQ